MNDIKPKYEIAWPFCMYSTSYSIEWKPGTNETNMGVICHGKGLMLVDVISVYKPPNFQTRVFYTLNFIAPDGSKFGSKRLRIKSLGRFRQLIKGYRTNYQGYNGE